MLIRKKSDMKMNYLKIYAIISTLLTLFCLYYYFKNSYESISILCFCILPILSSFIILIIGSYTKQKYPLITKVIANILNLFVILAYAFMILIFLSIDSAFKDLDIEYVKLEDYEKALHSYTSEAINHFPQKIPPNISNVEMYRSPSSFTGDSDFHLKFDTDKAYIQQVKNQYKEEIAIKHSDYTNQRAKNVLSYFIHQDTKDWDIITIDGGSSCYQGIATKDITIIYMLYCD